MRIALLTSICAVAYATVAQAADVPSIGPAPSWVKPVALPAAPIKDDGAAVRVLLFDQQVAFAPGLRTIYTEYAVRIQTPQGLSEGNISLPWRPETDVLTFHKVLIKRDGKVTDVLASGKPFTVVRRESNLESALLDGVLTANIQPEGLQVGDTIEFAASIASSDPVMQNHIEQLIGTPNGLTIARAHLRVQWPENVPVRLRQTGPMQPLNATKGGSTKSVEITLENLEPVVPPKGAPARYRLGRMVEVSDFADWSDLAALMAPLYKKAAVLPKQGPLADELARIKASSPDPKVRAEAALALVQNEVRYVALLMGAGALVPADAETTWARRFGDCKGKTALLLALLGELGVAAEPVAVSTQLGDGMDARLPMIAHFDHVLVRARIAGRTYWMDGTRSGDTSLDRLAIPNFGWGLPLVPKGAALVRMVPPPLERPSRDVVIRIDARAGLLTPAPTRIETIFRGDDALIVKLSLANLSGDARDRALREYWKNQYDFIDVGSASATFDPKSGEQRLVMEGNARMDWSDDYYETDGTGVGYKADFARVAGPSHDAPLAVLYPYFTRISETILLPSGFKKMKMGSAAEVNETVAGIEYRRHVTFTGDVFTIEKTERSIVPEISFKEATTAQARLRELAEQRVYIPKPANYVATDKDVAAALATTPTTASAFIDRGVMLLDKYRFDEAIADFTKAAELKPGDAWALANRGMARAWKGDTASAEKDLLAAAAIDPRNEVVFRARGMLAEQKGDHSAAITAYSKSLEIDRKSEFALGRRATAYLAAGDKERALIDIAAALKLNSRLAQLYLMRANIFRGQGKDDLALAEGAAVVAANPDEAYAHVVSANIYSFYKKRAEAMRAFDRAIALKPEAYIYVNRSLARPVEDIAGRNADIDAALKLEPNSEAALGTKAALQVGAGKLAEAVETYSKVIQLEPRDPDTIVRRGLVYDRMGQTQLAQMDYLAARTLARSAGLLNNICWAKATAGRALDSALLECNEALKKSPDAAGFLDSRALVLLRLGRVEEAINDYDRALAKSPRQSSSLFGRAVAWSRKGDRAKAAADLTTAEKINPEVRAEFKRYGVNLE